MTSSAITAIHASAAKDCAVDLDSRVLFLRKVCEATRIEFTEAHNGMAGAQHIGDYHNSPESFRHRRAAILLRARRNHLVGARIGGQLVKAAMERSLEYSVRRLAANDATLVEITTRRVA